MDTQSHAPEIIIGLVGALGANLDRVIELLTEQLKAVGSLPQIIHLAAEMEKFWRNGIKRSAPRDEYVDQHQTAGNQLRKRLDSGNALARLAIHEIMSRREQERIDGVVASQTYIIRQLKRPDEVDLLRKVYGNSFYLIAAYCPRDLRVERVSLEIATSHDSMRPHKWRSKAEELIDRDENEAGDPLGQNVRETFPKADVFLNTVAEEELEKSIARFVDLLFGTPFITPHMDEFAMFHARAAALRSSDPDLQVGAVIASTDGGDIVAVGTNEVPKAGGGLYWEGDPADARDFHQSTPDTGELKKTALGEILTSLSDNGWLTKDKSKLTHDHLVRQAIPIVKSTRLMSVGEYGRTVHAEMAALLDAARRGVSVAGKTLYTTTFPCHNCARHIVAAGVMRVVYINPYPKSLASLLHADSIRIEAVEEVPKKVTFQPYCGVAPRIYMEIFEKRERRAADGRILSWERHGARPRRCAERDSYIGVEREIAEAFEEKVRGVHVPGRLRAHSGSQRRSSSRHPEGNRHA